MLFKLALRTVPSMQHVILLGIMLPLSACAAGRETSTENISVQLAPCPHTPNCVSSLNVDGYQMVEPLRYHMAQSTAIDRLYGLIEKMPRAKVVRSTQNYLHIEFRSAVFGFIDDVEFVFGDRPGIIHVRSASRVGYWDLGVNRRRVERIREEFTKIDN